MSIYLIRKGKKKRIFSRFQETTVTTQFIGLMFQNRVSKPLLFKANGRISIHSFFCPFFDAVFLDKQGKVVKALSVAPWRSKIAVNAFYLFEFPPGTIAKCKIKKGDELKWTR